ncbi:L-lactate permease [Streptomyces sp. NBC_00887]|uniref:L-lactate permease n=1 Tax=Streptomyces sp. NBC_00887 TaxID=2975859 RepID=UPI00386EFD78|nr:L-lactate permease [Streptomyces sp. NBC_00887]WSY36124.1 L-lactate permease [Streptomyces sp. NBC_00887]
MYRQTIDPVFGSLAWSALLALVPIAALFVFLGVFRTKAWVASWGSLAVAALVAVLGYGMPTGQAVLAAGQGAAFGLFPLAWTLVAAIWIHSMTVHSGHFDVLCHSFAAVSKDQRIQAIIIAFCFGSLLEGLAGQGTPVAITTVMLVGGGFRPMRAAAVALVANTVPAAFGPLGLPITTLAKVSDLPMADLGAMAGRQVPIIAVFVPLLVVGIADGRRGVRQTWFPALACGVSYGLTQFVTSNYISVPLADISSALVSACVVTVVVRAQHVRRSPAPAPSVIAHPDTPQASASPLPVTSGVRTEVWRAYAPYLAIVSIFVFSQWKPVADALNSATVTFPWPGLHLLTSGGEPSTLPMFKFNWLAATGTLLLISGLATMVVLHIPPRVAVTALAETLGRLRGPITTISGLLALSFVMNASGQTMVLGTWLAGTGGAFVVISPILGWLGVALTGSDTSSNALFGALQVTAADKAGLPATLLTAANASGGVVGKMISLQNLTIAAAATGMHGAEGDLFRRMFRWSVLLLAGMCLIVFLQTTRVLGWMTVH